MSLKIQIDYQGRTALVNAGEDYTWRLVPPIDRQFFPPGQWLGTYQKDFGNDRFEFDDSSGAAVFFLLRLDADSSGKALLAFRPYGQCDAQWTLVAADKMTPGKVKNLQLAWKLAVSQYLGPALQRRLGMDAKEVLGGIMPGLLGAIEIVVTAAGVGAVLGAITGLFFPPAEAITPAAGAALGLAVAQFILTCMGLMFIYSYVAPRVGAINNDLFWGFKYAYEYGDIDRGARYLAEAMATLLALIIEAIVVAVAAFGFKVLRQSRYGQQMEAWVNKNWENLRGKFIEKLKGQKTPYLERNPDATPHEKEIGAWLHDLAERGQLRDVARVEEGVKPTGSSKQAKAGTRNPDPDFDFVDKNGQTSKADLYEVEFDKDVNFEQRAKKVPGYDPAQQPQFVLEAIGRDLSRNMIKKGGDQVPNGTLVVEFGKGATANFGVAEARSGAKWFFDTPNHSIARVIFIKNKTILLDQSR